MAGPSPNVLAWLVAYVDPKAAPPCIVEAGIFPQNRPTKATRHESFAQLVLLQTERASYVEAADEIKRILAGPEWRWIYRVPLLTSGFQHVWRPDNGRCAVCGVPQAAAAELAKKGSGDPDRCLVSHIGICSSCGGTKPILQGDALCVNCRVPSS